MNILLTNDDGIHAEGINSVYSILSKKHSVYIIAPATEKSACSNAITVRSQLVIKKIEERKFSVTGYPADCVIIGLSGNLIPEVDLVISGINHGPNVGDDLVFSGTVGGARTAYLFGKSALSISINSYKHASKYFNDAASFLDEFIDTDIKKIGRYSKNLRESSKGEMSSLQFFNINYPDLPRSEIKGKKYTYTGKRIYKDSFKTAEFQSDELVLQMGGYIESVFAEGSDTTELDNGFISITPLVIDCTNYSFSLLHYFRRQVF